MRPFIDAIRAWNTTKPFRSGERGMAAPQRSAASTIVKQRTVEGGLRRIEEQTQSLHTRGNFGDAVASVRAHQQHPAKLSASLQTSKQSPSRLRSGRLLLYVPAAEGRGAGSLGLCVNGIAPMRKNV